MTDFIQRAVIDALKQTELLGAATPTKAKNALLVIESTIDSIREDNETAYTEGFANVIISALERNLLDIGLNKVDSYIKNLRDKVASAAERDAQYRQDYAEHPEFYATYDAIAARRHRTERQHKWSKDKFLKQIAEGPSVPKLDAPHVYDPSRVPTQPAIGRPSAESRGHKVDFLDDDKKTPADKSTTSESAAPTPSTLPTLAKPPAVARPPALATSSASSSLPAVTRRTPALKRASGLLHVSHPAVSAASEKDTTDTEPHSKFAAHLRAEVEGARQSSTASMKPEDTTSRRPPR